MTQQLRVARTVGVAIIGTALAISLAACSPAHAKPSSTPKPHETGIQTTNTPTATPSGAPVGDGDVSTGTGFTAVFDDTHHVGVAVPDSWTDTDGTGFVDADGNDWVQVTAAPSISDYNSTWGNPGVEIAATPFTGTITQAQADADITALLTQLSTSYKYDDQCTPDETTQSYSDQVYTGYYSTWQKCGNSDTEALILTAYDNAGTHKVFLVASLVSDDDKNATLKSIIDSFQASFDDKAIAPRG